MEEKTLFTLVYDRFLSKITDDMYVELTESETLSMLKELLMSAIHQVEFPRQNFYDYNIEEEYFNIILTQEEINVLATYMVVEWIGQQLASIENTRQKYSSSDFKLTSQANQMSKLIELKQVYLDQGKHLQRLYKRRKPDKNGIMRSTFGSIMIPIEEGRHGTEV